MTGKILFIGDIFGQPGRRAVKEILPRLVEEYSPDLVLANGENAAAGFGITPALVEELLGLGIAVLTSGNHIWDKKEILPYLADHADGRLLRPANYPSGPGQAPGHGLYLGRTRAGLEYALMNLQGRVFMPTIDCPFRTADALLQQVPAGVKLRILDMHAEATSEKIAMGWYLDGRMTAVVGTHTHVPTADERILPNGTAFQTDIGMTGAYDSVIGFRPDEALHRFLLNTPRKLEVAKRDIRMSGAMIEVDEATGRAARIVRIHEKVDE